VGQRRAVVTWTNEQGVLSAREPTSHEVRAHAPALANAYNDAHNRVMMSHTIDFTPADVVEHYAATAADGARTFLLFVDGALAGDADLRKVTREAAEVAIMVGERAAQGKGLGTRFGVMVHAFAFRELGVERVYASILRENTASLRMFEKLGYRIDASATARTYAEGAGDVTMSIGARELEREHGEALREIAIALTA